MLTIIRTINVVKIVFFGIAILISNKDKGFCIIIRFLIVSRKIPAAGRVYNLKGTRTIDIVDIVRRNDTLTISCDIVKIIISKP